MIPSDHEELSVLAGEYVLGVLDPPQMREIEAALGENAVLRDAVAFWEQKLHPLSALAGHAEPSPGHGTQSRRALQELQASTPQPEREKCSSVALGDGGIRHRRGGVPSLCRAHAGGSPLVAVLHAPEQQAASWIATTSGGGLHLSAVANEMPPPGHTFELWAIAAHAKRPERLGVIPSNGTLRIAALPRGLGEGATLAISIEPPAAHPPASRRARRVRRRTAGDIIQVRSC